MTGHINIFTLVILSWCLTPELWWETAGWNESWKRWRYCSEGQRTTPTPRTSSPLEPHALRVSRQPWAPFNSSLQLNDPLQSLKICMFILIPVWLMETVPNPQVLPLHSSTYVPCPQAWIFYSQEQKTLNWKKKKSWLQTHQPLYVPNSRLGNRNSSLLLRRHYLSPPLPALAVNSAMDGFGVELGSSWSCLPPQPPPFQNTDAPG